MDDTEKRQRLVAMTKLFVTFDAEPSQQRIAAYIEATAQMPLRWLLAGVDAMIRTFKGRGVPRPAEILEAANAARSATQPWLAPSPHALAAGRRGETSAQALAVVLDEADATLAERAREIREAGELVPRGFVGRLLSYYAAANQLGIHYPVDVSLQASFDEALLAWGDLGHDVDWWCSVSLHRISLDVPDPCCSCGVRVTRSGDAWAGGVHRRTGERVMDEDERAARYRALGCPLAGDRSREAEQIRARRGEASA